MATNFFRIIFDLSINQKRKYMSTITLTDLEKQLLLGINNSDYGDDLGDPIWTGSDQSGIKGKALSGVYSSLSQKGLIWVNAGMIGLTKTGIEVCLEQHLCGKYEKHI